MNFGNQQLVVTSYSQQSSVVNHLAQLNHSNYIWIYPRTGTVVDPKDSGSKNTVIWIPCVTDSEIVFSRDRDNGRYLAFNFPAAPYSSSEYSWPIHLRSTSTKDEIENQVVGVTKNRKLSLADIDMAVINKNSNHEVIFDAIKHKACLVLRDTNVYQEFTLPEWPRTGKNIAFIPQTDMVYIFDDKKNLLQSYSLFDQSAGQGLLPSTSLVFN